MEHLEDRTTPALFAPGGYVDGRVLVTFADPARSADSLTRLLHNPLAVKSERLGHGIYQVDLAAGVPVAAAVTLFAAAPGVRSVEPDYIVSVAEGPNDPGYTGGSLWGL